MSTQLGVPFFINLIKRSVKPFLKYYRFTLYRGFINMPCKVDTIRVY